jgi:hypothetical protein
MQDRLSQNKYTIRQKIFELLGKSFQVFDSNNEVVFFCKMKAFKLREDIRLYTSESMETELLTIKARNIMDFSAAYDVMDAQTRQPIGVLKRKGMMSMLKDEWIIMTPGDRDVGYIKEDSMLLAVARRVIGIIPQKYTAELDGRTVCTYQQNFNPFVFKIEIDFSHDEGKLFDRRLGLAAGILLAAIEGRQE